MEEDPPWALKARRMSGIKNAADEERRKKEEEERTKKEEEEKKRLAEEKRKQRDDWTKRASTNMGKVDIDKKIKETKLSKSQGVEEDTPEFIQRAKKKKEEEERKKKEEEEKKKAAQEDLKKKEAEDEPKQQKAESVVAVDEKELQRRKEVQEAAKKEGNEDQAVWMEKLQRTRDLSHLKDGKKSGEQQDQAPEWLKKALVRGKKDSLDQEIQAKRSSFHPGGTQVPDWIEKAKKNRLSRDMSGIDKWTMKKPPALPQEPSWLAEWKNKKTAPTGEATSPKKDEDEKSAQQKPPTWMDKSETSQKSSTELVKTVEETQIEETGVTVKVSLVEKQKLERRLEIMKRKLHKAKKRRATDLETLDKANDALSKVKDVVGESCALVDKAEETHKASEGKDAAAAEEELLAALKAANQKVKEQKSRAKGRKKRKKRKGPINSSKDDVRLSAPGSGSVEKEKESLEGNVSSSADGARVSVSSA